MKDFLVYILMMPEKEELFKGTNIPGLIIKKEL